MRAASSILALGFAVGCGAADCQIADRDGTYRVTYATVDGSCGDLDSTTVTLEPQPAPPAGPCTYSRYEWSSDECSLDASYACEFPGDDLRVTYVGVTTQADDDGAVIEGSMSVLATRLSTGQIVCSGTYDMRFERL